AGNSAAAAQDRAAVLTVRPVGAQDWVERARFAAGPTAALADYRRALEADPRHLTATREMAALLAEKLAQTEEAMGVLNRAIEAQPDSVPLRLERALLLAGQGYREKALPDAEACLARDREVETLYQAACVFAMTSRQVRHDRDRAVRL